MEEFVIAGKPAQVLSKEDIESEIAQAALDRREADFSGKTLKFFSLPEKNFDYGINLENSLIIGNVFLAGASANGIINMAGAVIDGSFSFGRGKIIGDLIMEKAWIGQTVNMVGMNLTGSIKCNQMRVNGFISLDKAVVLGDVDFRQIEMRDYCQGDKKIKGDVFLKYTQINGSLDLSDATATGDIVLENALIRRNLIAKNLKLEGKLAILNSIYPKEQSDFGGTPPDKIVK
jgi:cytoskeletal protein CcmA (bactofilin family)